MAKLRKRYFLVVGFPAIALLPIVGLYTYTYVALRYKGMQITPKDQENMTARLKILTALAHFLHSDPNVPVINLESVGFPAQESELKRLRTAVVFFAAEYGRMPRSTAEIALSPMTKDAGGNVVREYEKLAKDCELMPLHTGATALVCAPMSATDRLEVLGATESFDPRNERFYARGDKAILFIPPAI